MQLQPRRILNEIEEIKYRLISLEISIIESEKASKKDIEDTRLAMKEYKNKKVIPFNF